MKLLKKTFALICLLVLAGSIVLLAGCEKESVQTPPSAETQEQISEEAVPPTPPFAEDLIKPPETARAEAPEQLLTELRCVDNKIEARITNILNEKMELSKAVIFINGLLKRNPECDKSVLEPGESTFCENLISKVNLKDRGNKLLFRIYGLQTIDYLNCR